MNKQIEEKLKLLPSSPGVYKMLDASGDVIYVGKAVSLKNRVRQYFQNASGQSSKVAALVSHIEDFEILLTSNETEALTLESNLIKQLQPRYNILLKDDKHFPYIRVDFKQDFPQVQVVRRVQKDSARYLGPYLSSAALRDALNVVREHFPVRHCRKDLKRSIARHERPCLMYHVGKCCAPCTGKVTAEEYHALLEQVCTFLKGESAAVISELTEQMFKASEMLEFERAAAIRNRIDAIRALGEKQLAIAVDEVEQDVFAYCTYEGEALVFALFIRDGKVIGTEEFEIINAEEDDAGSGEAISAFIKQYYTNASYIPAEILLCTQAAEALAITSWLSDRRGKRVSIHVPKRGKKRRLTELAQRNGMGVLQKRHLLKLHAWERGEGAVAALAGVLGLTSIPTRMECFDCSHIQGRDTVCSMVVFLHGAPAPKEYRRFRIKSTTEGDDCASMREALKRRFSRAKEADERFYMLPDLLVVDGGQQQLNAAEEVLCEYGFPSLEAIGLAENSGNIYHKSSEGPIILERSDPALQILERLRDEAHRFAIQYHRSLRGKNTLYSKLDEIPGVGNKRKRILFDAFPTLEAMQAATKTELSMLKGIDKRTARAVFEYFNPKQDA